MLFLIGMPGVGKTYWGRIIAQEYGLQHIDMDEMIVQQHGKSIAAIFEEDGEDTFRKMEATLLRTIAENMDDKTVISCGGGTPVYSDNLTYMNAKGCTVYLKADVSYIESRLSEVITGRPLIDSSTDRKERLTKLLEVRKNIYEQVQFIMHAETLTVANFAQIIAQCKQQH